MAAAIAAAFGKEPAAPDGVVVVLPFPPLLEPQAVNAMDRIPSPSNHVLRIIEPFDPGYNFRPFGSMYPVRLRLTLSELQLIGCKVVEPYRPRVARPTGVMACVRIGARGPA